MGIVSFICLGIGWALAIVNIFSCLRALRNKRRGIRQGFSSIPLLSLVFCGIAYAAGGKFLGFLVFLPCLLDPGTWLTFLLPYILYREHISHRRP